MKHGTIILWARMCVSTRAVCTVALYDGFSSALDGRLLCGGGGGVLDRRDALDLTHGRGRMTIGSGAGKG